MSGESNADVYASFGVNSAVTTSGSITEHEQNMLELDVRARDGDDSIEVARDSSDPYGSNVDPFGQEDTEGDRIQVRVGGDEDEAPIEEPSEEMGEAEGEPEADFQPLGETPSELVAASEQLAEHEAGFQEMVNSAAERGMSNDTLMRIQTEYASEEGISESSYKELAAAGYSKSFVDSYIRGQEALVESYINGVVQFAGGPDQFNSMLAHLEANNPEAARSLETAFENRDLGTVKAIINLAGQSRSKAFGKAPSRSVTKQATPAKPEGKRSEGFGNQAEMIKAMSDSRYRHDTAYRREVEQKVINSRF